MSGRLKLTVLIFPLLTAVLLSYFLYIRSGSDKADMNGAVRNGIDMTSDNPDIILKNAVVDKNYRIAAAGDKVKLISFDSDKKQAEVKAFDYEKPDDHKNDNGVKNRLTPFILHMYKKPGENVFLLVLGWYSKNRIYLINEFTIDDNNSFHTKKVYHDLFDVNFGLDLRKYFFDKDEFITNRGFVVSKKEGIYSGRRETDPEIWEILREKILSSTGKKLHLHGILFLDDNRVIIQAADLDNLKNSYFGEYGRFVRNYIIKASVKNKEISFVKQFNYTPVDDIHSTEYPSMAAPLSLSPDGKEVAFLARTLTGKDKKAAPVLRLYTYNVESNRIEEIVNLEVIGNPFMFHYSIPIKWNQNQGVNLITFSCFEQWHYKPDEGKIYDVNSTVIIDVDKKKIIKKWNFFSPSIRWSPDGRFLGFIRNDVYYNNSSSDRKAVQEKDAGSLYLYDLKDDSLKKIDQDKNYVDFYWLDDKE